MPEQVFDYIDLLGPVAVAVIFAAILFLISFFCLNWCCILKHDDITDFERLGAKYNLKLGPHSLHEVRRGGWMSTRVLQQEELIHKHVHAPAHA
uniref:Nematode cuticle collagen N-terminal domain-containing protein n=1 Tax=Panagrellus redivivus TaxID=6233 RepID=A0A7E4UT59_PANRE